MDNKLSWSHGIDDRNKSRNMMSMKHMNRYKTRESSDETKLQHMTLRDEQQERRHHDVVKPQSYYNSFASFALDLGGCLVWPCMLLLPLILTSDTDLHYSKVFPVDWYEVGSETGRLENPKPLGLSLGILAVAVGHVFIVLYHYFVLQFQRNGKGDKRIPIQKEGAPSYAYFEGLVSHLSQPEGFVLLSLYLSGTWMTNLMPSTYYSFEGGIDYLKVALCLVCQDGIQYIMHRLEHVASSEVYKRSHKPHHRFTNPKLFDAFNGSAADTILMILVPLYITAWMVKCNVWTYMAFGSMYANWLTLIHSEYPHSWDNIFRMFGLGTPSHHHVHHKLFKWNYGHLCMWFDMIFQTYRDPISCARYFN